MKLLNWVKYEKIINVVIVKLLKRHYIFFIDIHVFKQLSFILLSMFFNNTKKYFNFNNIDMQA